MRGLEKIKELIHMSEIPNRTLKSGLFGNYQGYMNYKQYYYDQTNKLPNGYSINNIRISYENFFKIVKKEDIIVTSDHNKNENQELFFKYKDLFITCPALSPKIALKSLSSGVGLISPFGVTFPTRIIPGVT